MVTVDMREFQQLGPEGGATGPVDCSAWTGAILTAAWTDNDTILTGREIRLATDEPIPDKGSPGLNLNQVDDAVRKLTKDHVDLDTHWRYPIADAERRLIAGDWGGVQVLRGPLVDHGFGGSSSFRGPHDLSVHSIGGVPVIGDPLVPYTMRAGWPAIWAAAGALPTGNGNVVGYGFANIQFTIDKTPDWRWSLHPMPGHQRVPFFTYKVVGNTWVSRHLRYTAGYSAPCTPPHTFTHPGMNKGLVMIESGSLEPEYVISRWAHPA